MITIPSPRMQTFTGFLICAALISIALYFQHRVGMEPCPLCILQRIAIMAIGLTLLLATIFNVTGPGRRLTGILTILAAIIGGAISARHVWLQGLPEDEIPTCGPGLDYMLDAFPLTETLAIILQGSGECAEVSWRMLGLSMPGWMLVIFAAFSIFGVWLSVNRD